MRKKIFMLALMSTGFVMILFSRLTLVQKGFRYEELSRKETVKEPSKEKFKGAVKKELKETSKNELSAETARAAIESEVPWTHVVLYYTSWWPDHGSQSCIFTLLLILENTACYAGFLLAPAEGFDLQP